MNLNLYMMLWLLAAMCWWWFLVKWPMKSLDGRSIQGAFQYLQSTNTHRMWIVLLVIGMLWPITFPALVFAMIAESVDLPR